MEEMKKVKRVVGKELEGAPHETLLVVDATNGQNAIAQAKTFNEALSITGIVITKLDGTAKGGFLLPIAHSLKIPVRFVGVGEKIDDLIPFSAKDFSRALFE
jgi:fused signal recognition particle receptor